jgi:hypothetical protein
MSAKRIDGHVWVVAVLVGMVGLALLAVHGVALRAFFSRAAIPIGAAAAIVAVAGVMHLGLLAPLASRLSRHLRSKRD